MQSICYILWGQRVADNNNVFNGKSKNTHTPTFITFIIKMTTKKASIPWEKTNVFVDDNVQLYCSQCNGTKLYNFEQIKRYPTAAQGATTKKYK